MGLHTPPLDDRKRLPVGHSWDPALDTLDFCRIALLIVLEEVRGDSDPNEYAHRRSLLEELCYSTMSPMDFLDRWFEGEPAEYRIPDSVTASKAGPKASAKAKARPTPQPALPDHPSFDRVEQRKRIARELVDTFSEIMANHSATMPQSTEGVAPTA